MESELARYRELVGRCLLFPDIDPNPLVKVDKDRNLMILEKVDGFELKRAGFSQELKNLWPLQKDGLLMISDDNLTVTEAGRMFLRSIAMEFDEYLSKDGNRQRFSKVI